MSDPAPGQVYFFSTCLVDLMAPQAGLDAIALKIREVAGASGVPIVENPPLARALHATVEIDQEIPTEHYQAVAEVIGYVMRLNQAVRGR